MENKPLKTRMVFTGRVRRDGRYPVTFIYPGAPNAFGGYDPHRTIKRLLTRSKASKLVQTYDRIGIVENMPPEFMPDTNVDHMLADDEPQTHVIIAAELN